MSDTSKPTVLHLLPTLATGGAERALAKLLRASNGVNHEVCVLFPIPTTDRLVAEEVEQAHVPVHCLNIIHPFRQWTQALRNIRDIIRTRNIDIVITYLTLTDILGRFAARKEQTPIVCWLRSTLREWKYLPLTLANGCTAWMVDAFFTVSPVCVDIYQRFFGVQDDRTFLIPNGVDESFFQHHAEHRTNLRTQYQTPHDAFVFSYTAVMRPRKGHETLLTAFAHVVKKESRVHLWLIGDGPLRLSLESHAASLGIAQHVHFLGRQKNVARLLDASDAFVFPSEYEGMSNALIEAMAMGLPIVSTNIPENASITGEKAAMLVPPNDEEALADAMRILLDSPERRERLAKHALTLGSTFSLKKTAELFEAAVRDVLKRTPCSEE